tara:strand:- start:27488 stop:28561 length:1074 start_codon:yes stop_codon:yes gene_type:complete
MGKSKAGSGSDGDVTNGSIPRITLEQFADALVQGFGSGGSGKGQKERAAKDTNDNNRTGDASTSNSTVTVAQWTDNSQVFLLHFQSAWRQRDAMGRASIFLEDLDLHGCVPEFIPSGQRGGVANYSGHNMRVDDLCTFLNLLQVEKPGGKGVNESEKGMVDALVRANVMRVDKTSGEYFVVGDGKKNSSMGSYSEEYSEYSYQAPNISGSAIAAVAGSSDKTEVKAAVLHEAMHMVFYCDSLFSQKCYEFWEEDVSDAEKLVWITFLKDLRYNVLDKELVVNEFQAYMCTERQMFGGGFRDGGGGGGGKSQKKGKSKSNDDSSDDALSSLQKRFALKAKEWVPYPPSVGDSCKVVWQ